VVCVLSGGSAKGAAHVGAIRALEDWELKPTHFVGTSIGAVVAASFASGLPYDEVLRRISTLTRRDVAALSPRALLGPFASHLFQAGVWREAVEMLVPARGFDDLETPLTVTAVDAQSGDLVLFGAEGRSQVPLVDALCASCALPLYFPPARIGDRQYLDGGVRAVFPLDVAAQFNPDLVFGVNVGPTLSDTSGNSTGLVGAHRRAMRIMMAAQSEEVITRWTREQKHTLVLVQPVLEGRTTFAVEGVVDYVESGYRAAYRALCDWRPH
jgi:NTE family protein